MDLTLYKNQLEKILKDVDEEIDVQFGKSDETKINLSNDFFDRLLDVYLM